MKVAIVDVMANLQSINKPDEIKGCAYLAGHFINRVLQKYSESDDVRLIIDRYDVPSSLKIPTGARKQGGQSRITSQTPQT